MKAVEKKEDEKALLRQLKEKLNWYTMEASDEEYDEEAVESILCLLDRLEPVAEDAVPDVDDAWERFREMAEERGLGPAKAENAAAGEAAEGLGSLRSPDALETAGPLAHRGAEEPEMSEAGGEAPAPGGAVVDMAAVRRKERKKDGVRRYGKCAAAAVLVVLALMAVGDMQAGASIDAGFFHWLRRDETKIQMVTSPENLDDITDAEEAQNHFDRDEVPEWAEEWHQIDKDFDMPENYEWQNFEIHELDNFNKVTSHYFDKFAKREILLGMVIYLNKVSYITEGFMGYNYSESYELYQKQMSVYSKVEDTGKVVYIICFYDDNYQFFIQGQDDLDELKSLMERYWLCVKNKLEKIKILCNKKIFEVIYKIEG